MVTVANTTTDSALFQRSQERRLPLLPAEDLVTLAGIAHESAARGSFGHCFAAVEGLLCQADRGALVPEILTADILEALLNHGFSAEQLQGLADRLESLEFHARTRRAP